MYSRRSFICIVLCSKFVFHSMLLRLLLMTYNAKASLPISGKTGTELDDNQWIVLKEEIINTANNTALRSNGSSSLSIIKKISTNNLNATRSNIRNDALEKDKSLFTCPNITLKIGEYDIRSNDTLYVKAFQKKLNSSFYIQDGDSMTICKPTKKEEKLSTSANIIIFFLTYAHSLITMLSAMCSFSKNSTYLKIAFASWFSVSSNIFLWIIVILIIPGTQSLFSWVPMSVNMNQSVFITSAWMALLTSNSALKFFQNYTFLDICKRTVTVNVTAFALLAIGLSLELAFFNFICNRLEVLNNDALSECLFCNPAVYATLFMLVTIDSLFAYKAKKHTSVGLDYASYHLTLCKFCIYNFVALVVGAVAVVKECHIFLWIYTLLNFIGPLYFMKNMIPRLQTLLAERYDGVELDNKLELLPQKQERESVVSHKLVGLVTT